MITTNRVLVQLTAVASLRLRLFVNSLRSTRGKLELFSHVLVSIAFAIGGLGGAFGMGIAAYLTLSAGKPQLLAMLFWFVFVFWQVFPLMSTAFTNNPDASDLLRFPLSYRAYFLVRMAYGAFDPVTGLVGLWCCGILAGVGSAKAALLPWTLLVLSAFALFNLLFLQMIFAWVERWLAQRRTREIMSVLFVLAMLSFQLIGPAARHFSRKPQPELQRYVQLVASVQGILPPGLATDAIVQSIYPQWGAAMSSLALLVAFVLIIGYVLHARLLSQYRGENLSEVAAATQLPKANDLRLGWNLPGFSAPVSAVFEKEIRYLFRSGPLLLTLIMPIFVLIVFRLGPLNSARHTGIFLHRTSNMAFPAAAAYVLFMLANLLYNSFGADGGGVQFFYASPVSFRDIVLAKNLTHVGILAAELMIAWIAVTYLYGRPALDITVASLAGLLFAAPLNFGVGNLLSIYAPKKLDYSKYGRQRAAQTTVLISLGVQFFVIGVGVGAFWIARHYGIVWIATVILLGLAGASLAGYIVILRRVDGVAQRQTETMVAELCRA